MYIFRNNYVKVLGIKECSLGRTKFQHRMLAAGNMAHRTDTERKITGMWTVIVWYRKEIIVEDVYDEDRIQVESLRAVILQLRSLSDKIGTNQWIRYLRTYSKITL